MTFRSILSPRAQDDPPAPLPSPAAGGAAGEAVQPEYFPDLNLDQVVAAATVGYGEYGLEPFFYRRLGDIDAVRYRHEVFRDLQRPRPRRCVGVFAQGMRAMRDRLAEVGRVHDAYQKQRWFLDAVDGYVAAVDQVAGDLAAAQPASDGLREFTGYLGAYTASDGFRALRAEVTAVRAALDDIRYTMAIRGDRVTVDRYGQEEDYGAEVLATFDKFAQGAVRDYRVHLVDSPDMNHVEAAVLALVARLYPDAFAALDAFCANHRGYLDATIARFDREVHFYLAYLEYLRRLTDAGLTFCYPQVSAESKAVDVRNAVDLALATVLAQRGESPVPNDIRLTGPERVIVVSGPNQGGKTTLARTFGQLHHLAGIGCPVPGASARLFLCDEIFTRFEREEDATTLRGKLEDDLLRIRDILARATPDSIVIMNEIFTSTSLQDALFLGGKVLDEIIARDLLCVCVTFVDEWSTRGPSTVSMVSTVRPDDPTTRTFKVVRRPADGRSYAASIAEKYGLTYARLRERIGS